MGEPACLHIQDRAWGPIRVVEIPWISVRIGSSPRCEVRLADPVLPREVCRLERGSGEWRITPSGKNCVIELGSGRVECTVALAFDAPFRIGPYVLTLRRDRASQPDWAMHEMGAKAPAARVEPPRRGSVRTSFRAQNPPVKVAAARPAAASAPSWARETDRWANRWREAGAGLETRDRPKPADRPRDLQARSASEGLACVELGAAVDPTRVLQARSASEGLAWVEPGAAVDPTRAPAPPLAPEISRSLRLLETPFILEDLKHESSEHVFVHPEIAPEQALIEPPAAMPAAALAVAPAPEPPVAPEPVSAVAPEPAPPVAPAPSVAPEPVSPVAPAPPVSLEPARPARDASPPGMAAGLRDRQAARLEQVEWPRACEVLASYEQIRRARTTAEPARAVVKRPMPTVLREPETWAPPVWLAGPVIVGMLLVLGLGGGAFSIAWAADSGAAAIFASRLFAPPARWTPLPDAARPPGTRWLATTARHLAHHALANSRADQPDDELRDELEQALAAAPLEPEARLALANLEPRAQGDRTMAGGLIHESRALAAAARRLARAGKKDEALVLFRRALEWADQPGLVRPGGPGAPAFSPDSSVERYLIPGEDRVRAILIEITADAAWKPADWLKILPDRGLVQLAAARLLLEHERELGRPILDRLADQTTAGPASMLDLAIRAEALALLARWNEADESYRRAIEAAPEGVVKRALWFNLADVVSRLDDRPGRPGRQDALREAAMTQESDDVSRRATLARRGSLVERTRAQTNPRAN